MKTIAIISRKGGVGKTSTAHALGAGLMKRGKKVLFIDLDSQANLSYTLKAQPKGTATNAMMFLKEYCTAIEAIWKQPQGDIIPATEQLSGADIFLTDTGKEYKLKEGLELIKDDYDYCIIDTPAALGILTINALTAADFALIPVQAEIYSLQGIGKVKDAIESVKKYCNRDLDLKGILVTRYKGHSVLPQDMKANLEEAAAKLNTKVFDTTIRECISIAEAQAQQTDIFSYAPRSNAAKDYNAFIDEFIAKEG